MTIDETCFKILNIMAWIEYTNRTKNAKWKIKIERFSETFQREGFLVQNIRISSLIRFVITYHRSIR